MTDGLLDVVFFPADNGPEALYWILASRTRRHLDSPEVLYATGARVRVQCDQAAAQADGDYMADSRDLHSVELACVPRALNVLLPA
jgi:diacylglycerol kinase family enzyme